MQTVTHVATRRSLHVEHVGRGDGDRRSGLAVLPEEKIAPLRPR